MSQLHSVGLAALALGSLFVLAACGDRAEPLVGGVRQTELPGHVTAGGSSSGEVMQRTAAPPAPAPAGTPGIPQGAEGNTGGAAMGGVVPKSAADDEKLQLAASMDAVAARWRSRASAEGWPVHAPTPVDAASGIAASSNQDSSSGQPGGQRGAAAARAPIRSEKAGTAPLSTDVKTGTKPPTQPSVKARAPDAAN